MGSGEAAAAEIAGLGKAGDGAGLAVGAEVDGGARVVDEGFRRAGRVLVHADDRVEDGGVYSVVGRAGGGDHKCVLGRGLPADVRGGVPGSAPGWCPGSGG